MEKDKRETRKEGKIATLTKNERKKVQSRKTKKKKKAGKNWKCMYISRFATKEVPLRVSRVRLIVVERRWVGGGG
jgi:hypothetical protein